MSTSLTEGLETSLTTDGSIESVVESLVETVQAQADLIDELRDEVDELRGDLDDERASRTKEAAEDRKRISDLEDRADDVEQKTNGSKQGVERTDNGSTTPIERLSRAEDVSEVTDSVSVERAVSLFKHVTDWGRRTPKGYTLRPKDRPKELLESHRDESLNWKQYYRAAEALERLSEGAVTFVKTERHGKTLVFHDHSEAFERMSERLSASTAGTTV